MLLQYLILEKKIEYYYYLLKLYKNTVMYQKLLVTFCGNRNFIEDLFDRYKKLWVTAESVNVTSICKYQKLLLLFILLILELT